MKNQILIASATIALVLLSGCAGQNNTLFMTKSNAGLDFDAKPPTAEITISRKEAVIAPAFEGGQTLPVMASFKPKTGMKGFNNFFVGVDQTFAGGDAALAMAMLYGDTSAPAATPDAIAKFDSKLPLTKAPKYKNVFRRIAEPGEVRPFIFGTDTMLGLKVAWSGAGGQMPDTVKVGFNRKEFAWAPVTQTTNIGNTTHPYAVQMPSFLATIESRSGTDTNGTGISALQYFATGKAATHLAAQPRVRYAMLERADPGATQDAEAFTHGQATLKKHADEAALRNQVNTETVKLKTADPAKYKTFLGWCDANFPDVIPSKLAEKPITANWKKFVDRLEAEHLDQVLKQVKTINP